MSNEVADNSGSTRHKFKRSQGKEKIAQEKSQAKKTYKKQQEEEIKNFRSAHRKSYKESNMLSASKCIFQTKKNYSISRSKAAVKCIFDSLESFKTKSLYENLKKFNFNSALFIYSSAGIDKNFKMASSNIPKISILNFNGINVKDILLFDALFLEKKSVEEITARLS